ncbi:MAG TPA: hypothetical protein VF792_10485 [Ktedonobacterales bacterium]
MRNLRRLPPFLRVVFSVGLICLVATLALIVMSCVIWLVDRPLLASAFRWQIVWVNLLMLGNLYTAVANAYLKRFDLVAPSPLPLDSLREQALAVLLPSVTPLGAIALAFVIPFESDWFWIVFGVSLLGVVGVLASQFKLGLVPSHLYSR